MDNNSIIEKVKELIRKGNVSRIVVKRDGRELVNIPVNAGIAVGVVALAKPVLLLGGVLATVGFGCTVEVVKDDGNVVEVVKEEDNEKVRSAANQAVTEIKGVLHLDENGNADFEETVAADEPKDDEN